MILENNISLWIQIAPFSSDGSFPLNSSKSTSKYCDVFPFNFFSSTDNKITFNNQDTKDYYNFSYTLNGYSHQLQNGTYETIITSSSSLSNNTNTCQNDLEHNDNNSSTFIQQTIEHIWFYHWDDFSIPDQIYNDGINRITTRAAQFILNNKTVVVSCYSGRGR